MRFGGFWKMNMFEEELYVYTIEQLARYRRWLEHEYHMDMGDEKLKMQLHSTYWVEDMFPLIYEANRHDIDCMKHSNHTIIKASAVLKLYKVFLELRRLTVNGWNLSVAHKVIDDIAYRVFSSDVIK